MCLSKTLTPAKVIEANRRFAAERPDVPLHLGVTEAGLPPDGILKTRIAFEQLLSQGIGDTIRVSLTLPNPRKPEEITVGQQILDDIQEGRFRSVPEFPAIDSTSSHVPLAHGSRTKLLWNWRRRFGI